MKKGQISFDLLMTIIAALIFISSFQSFSHQMINSEKIISIQNQEKIIAENIKLLGNQARILINGDSNYAIKYRIPLIFEPGKPTGQDCNIFFIKRPSFIDPANDINALVVQYFLELNDGTIKDVNTIIDVNTVIPKLLNQTDLNCGEVLDLNNLGG